VRVWLIVNPAAGDGKAGKKAAQYEQFLRGSGVQVTSSLSQYPGHVYKIIAEREDLAGLDGIVAVGGDGTLFEILNALMTRYGHLPLPLGQIPVGTGNSLSRDLHPDGAAAALEAIVAGRLREIDVIRYEAGDEVHYFTNMMGIGFVTDINARSFRYKSLGKLAYALSVVLEVAHPATAVTRLTLDGHSAQFDTLFAEICNSRYTGGNMLLAPTAVLDDGLLEVLICRPMKRLRFLRVFPKVYKGTHVGLPEVEVLRGREGELAMEPPRGLSPDGEVFGTTPIRFQCLHRFLKIFA